MGTPSTVRVPPGGMDSPFRASRVAYRGGHATGSFSLGFVHGFTGVHPLSRAGGRRVGDAETPGDRRSGDRRVGGPDPEQLLSDSPSHDAPRVQISRTAEMGAGAGGASPFVYDVRGGGPNSFPRDRGSDSARRGFAGEQNFFVPATAEEMAGPYGRRLGQQPSGPRGGTVARRPPIAL